MIDIIRAHMERYPLMEARDLFKLIYQSAFGAEHLIDDPAHALSYINKEWSAVENGASLLEDIGGGYARLNIPAARTAGLSPACVCKLFVGSANGGAGVNEASRAVFDGYAALLRGLLPDDVLDAAERSVRESGYAPLRHSQTYRDAYTPAYRVIRADLAALWPTVNAVEEALAIQPCVTVALDGRCASGKTTRAALLAALYDADAVHMDDFFLPPHMRTDERLGEPGGNVHRERFLDAIASHLRGGGAFDYQAYDCSEGTYSLKHIRASRVRIVEGSYVLHPLMRALYDVRVFCDIAPDEQMERIVRRDGAEYARVFRDKWIPLEERYFKACGVMEACGVIQGAATA